MQESGLKVNQPASFAVSLNGAKGVIDAKVHSPSGALEECCVTEIDEGNLGIPPQYQEYTRKLTYAAVMDTLITDSGELKKCIYKMFKMTFYL